MIYSIEKIDMKNCKICQAHHFETVYAFDTMVFSDGSVNNQNYLIKEQCMT